jgi:hypothetical protein
MYWATILRAQTMASRRDPKAIDPRWYLTSQKTLVWMGLLYRTLEGPKYHIAVAQAMMKWEQASRKETAQSKPKPCM